MSNDTPQPKPTENEAPPSFPAQGAPQILPLEAARIRNLDSSPDLPRWQPEEGDFS